MQVSRIHVALVAVSCLAASTAFAGGGTITGTIDGKKKERSGTVVYVEHVAGKHAAGKVTMDQRGQKFVPAVLPVVVGSTVEFLNNDNTGHNVFSPDGEKYDLGTWDKGATRAYTFKRAGVYAQLCKMHPSMLAHIVVLQNPYFAVTDANGEFAIRDVPPGSYTVKVWNRRRKSAPIKVTVANDATVTITPKLVK